MAMKVPVSAAIPFIVFSVMPETETIPQWAPTAASITRARSAASASSVSNPQAPAQAQATSSPRLYPAKTSGTGARGARDAQTA
jgi:hypothetical protein